MAPKDNPLQDGILFWRGRVKLTSEATYLRDQAQQALHLARDSTNQVVVNTLIEVAVESLGRAGAIELIESLQEAATAWGHDHH
jgi:hypothetical protein